MKTNLKFIKTFESFTKNYLIDLEEVANSIGMSYDELMIQLKELGCEDEDFNNMIIKDNRIVFTDPSSDVEVRVMMDTEGGLPEEICFGISEFGVKEIAKIYKSMTDLKNDANAISTLSDTIVEKNENK
jgi:hypothetical protein